MAAFLAGSTGGGGMPAEPTGAGGIPCLHSALLTLESNDKLNHSVYDFVICGYVCRVL